MPTWHFKVPCDGGTTNKDSPLLGRDGKERYRRDGCWSDSFPVPVPKILLPAVLPLQIHPASLNAAWISFHLLHSARQPRDAYIRGEDPCTKEQPKFRLNHAEAVGEGNASRNDVEHEEKYIRKTQKRQGEMTHSRIPGSASFDTLRRLEDELDF
ncbi:hypothetical protein BJ165DRAFT_1534288 [Panaeolus papilionaceus]|nr:hypothetical protein BJ165DRAFT_1534288 [Panaeolus papilionaceus]